MSLGVSKKYGVLQLSFQTTKYLNPASRTVLQRMLSDWAHVQGSSVMQREQQKYDVKKKHQKPQSCLPKYLCRVLILSHW